MVMTQVNAVGDQVANLERRLNAAGTLVPDYVEKQMATINTHIEIFKNDVSTYASNASAQVQQVVQ